MLSSDGAPVSNHPEFMNDLVVYRGLTLMNSSKQMEINCYFFMLSDRLSHDRCVQKRLSEK